MPRPNNADINDVLVRQLDDRMRAQAETPQAAQSYGRGFEGLFQDLAASSKSREASPASPNQNRREARMNSELMRKYHAMLKAREVQQQTPLDKRVEEAMVFGYGIPGEGVAPMAKMDPQIREAMVQRAGGKPLVGLDVNKLTPEDRARLMEEARLKAQEAEQEAKMKELYGF
jgi:hypothetical protein